MPLFLKARHWVGLVALISASAIAQVDDIEGQVDEVDTLAQTLTVHGITVYVTNDTEFTEELSGLEDIHAGDSVVIDYEYENSRHIAKEIERDG
ncbi:DUF5666 domain-containing protein [Litchfieldella xinjiangensis]|uniref:DUF5666 domain-containing protein n=1 Tax=Litchfieldella xinjiangensis TaxID=1166948 RepID=UPI0005BB0DED|nr:DUF5666 domain-containing protein [Halomonas xinjiangensis]